MNSAQILRIMMDVMISSWTWGRTLSAMMYFEAIWGSLLQKGLYML